MNTEEICCTSQQCLGVFVYVSTNAQGGTLLVFSAAKQVPLAL